MKKKWKKIPPKYVVAGIVFILMALLLVRHRSFFYYTRQDDYNDMSGEKTEIAAEQVTVSQYFTISGNIQNIALLMTNDSGEDAVIHATLKDADTDQVLAETESSVPESAGNEEVVTFALASDGVDGQRNVYLTLEEATKKSKVSYCALSGTYEQSLAVNDENKAVHLRMSVVYGGGLNKPFFYFTTWQEIISFSRNSVYAESLFPLLLFFLFLILPPEIIK